MLLHASEPKGPEAKVLSESWTAWDQTYDKFMCPFQVKSILCCSNIRYYESHDVTLYDRLGYNILHVASQFIKMTSKFLITHQVIKWIHSCVDPLVILYSSQELPFWNHKR